MQIDVQDFGHHPLLVSVECPHQKALVKVSIFFFLISLGITKQAIWYVANVSTKCLMHTPFPDGERSLLLHPLRQTFNFSRTGSKHCILDWWVKSGTPRYLSFDFMQPTVGIARISLILEFETELLKNAPDLS